MWMSSETNANPMRIPTCVNCGSIQLYITKLWNRTCRIDQGERGSVSFERSMTDNVSDEHGTTVLLQLPVRFVLSVL